MEYGQTAYNSSVYASGTVTPSGYEKPSENGQILMELDKYPFSKRFYRVQGRFGISWQLSLTE